MLRRHPKRAEHKFEECDWSNRLWRPVVLNAINRRIGNRDIIVVEIVFVFACAGAARAGVGPTIGIYSQESITGVGIGWIPLIAVAIAARLGLVSRGTQPTGVPHCRSVRCRWRHQSICWRACRGWRL